MGLVGLGRVGPVLVAPHVPGGTGKARVSAVENGRIFELDIWKELFLNYQD